MFAQVVREGWLALSWGLSRSLATLGNFVLDYATVSVLGLFNGKHSCLLLNI